MVQREEYGSRLHEDFSDSTSDSRSSSDTRSERASTVHLDRRHSRTETLRGRSQEPVILDASALSHGDALVTEGNYDDDRNHALLGRTPSQVRRPMPIVDNPNDVLERTPSREMPSSYDLRPPRSEVRLSYLQLLSLTFLICNEQSGALVYGPHELSRSERSHDFERHKPREYNHHSGPHEYSQEDLDYYRNRDTSNYSHSTQGGNTYYIIPAGTNVIFQDEEGNEITRLAISVRSIYSN
jgi:hypothetical protein